MKKHEPRRMIAGTPFYWRSSTRKTETLYTRFRCPECGQAALRIYGRANRGAVCLGDRQAIITAQNEASYAKVV